MTVRWLESSWMLVPLLVVSLAIRVLAGYGWEERFGPGFFFGDTDSYWHLAERIAAGESYQYRSPEARVFRAPGYPLLLAAWFTLADDNPSHLWARGLSAVLGTLGVALTFALGRVCFDRRVGLVAAAVCAVHAEIVGLGVFLLSEAPFAPAMLAQLTLLVLCQRSTSWRSSVGWAIAAGLLGGVASLIRPSWLLFTPGVSVLALALPILGRWPIGKRLLIATSLTLGCAVVMTPWWIRNYQAVGIFVPTTLQVGASLYDGLRPDADGASDMRFVADFESRLRREQPDLSPEEFEIALDRSMRDAALDWASEHKSRVGELVFVKLGRMWNIWPNERGLQNPLLSTLVAVGFVPIVLLAGWGLWRFRDEWTLTLLLILPAAYVTALHVVFVSSIRYRQPVLPALIVLAVAAVLWTKPAADR
jgi:4-amino-4-deoxy-L-arabinose transferase-like glycosyltransferase